MKFNISISRGSVLCACGLIFQLVFSVAAAIVLYLFMEPGEGQSSAPPLALAFVNEVPMFVRFIVAAAIAWYSDRRSTSTAEAFATTLAMNATVVAICCMVLRMIAR